MKYEYLKSYNCKMFIIINKELWITQNTGYIAHNIGFVIQYHMIPRG